MILLSVYLHIGDKARFYGMCCVICEAEMFLLDWGKKKDFLLWSVLAQFFKVNMRIESFIYQNVQSVMIYNVISYIQVPYVVSVNIITYLESKNPHLRIKYYYVYNSIFTFLWTRNVLDKSYSIAIFYHKLSMLQQQYCFDKALNTCMIAFYSFYITQDRGEAL